MKIDFNEKAAMVTGAAGGIGAATAIEFAKAGADVALLDNHISEESDVVKKVTATGRKALCCNTDISDEKAVIEAFEKVKESFGRLDVMVNNAGITSDSFVKKMTSEQFKKVIDVNLFGTFLCARHAMLLMNEFGNGGSIVNISSICPFEGNIGQANYAASKMGIFGMSRTMAREFCRYGIRVNVVAPGFTDTPMTAKVPEKVRETLIDHIPLKRIGNSEDIANAILFLASDKAAFITGQILHVNGGAVLY